MNIYNNAQQQSEIKNMPNINLLKSKMVLKGETQIELAKVLGITRPALNVKMNGKNDFKQSEIYIIAKRYELTNDELVEIFFS